jgi:hypothetical protein
MERTETNPGHRKLSLPFSFFAGPGAWALQLLIGYGLSAQACMAGTKLWIYLVSGGAAVITLVSAVLAFQNWRSYSNSHNQTSQGMLLETEARMNSQEFIAISGALLSSIFFFLVLITGVAMIFLDTCPVITQPLP